MKPLTHTMPKTLATSKKAVQVNPPLVKVSVDPFNKAGQLQRCAAPGSKPKLLVAQQPALVYFPGEP
jgi:hypothetical protein